MISLTVSVSETLYCVSMKGKVTTILFVIAVLGLFDALFLTYKHFTHSVPPCQVNYIFSDCGRVLNGPYATMLNIPTAVWGVVYYSFVLLIISLGQRMHRKMYSTLLVAVTTGGFFFSAYFVFLQLVIIRAVCLYCMVSAFLCTMLFILSIVNKQMNRYAGAYLEFLE